MIDTTFWKKGEIRGDSLWKQKIRQFALLAWPVHESQCRYSLTKSFCFQMIYKVRVKREEHNKTGSLVIQCLFVTRCRVWTYKDCFQIIFNGRCYLITQKYRKGSEGLERRQTERRHPWTYNWRYLRSGSSFFDSDFKSLQFT